MEAFKAAVPVLRYSLHKGECGRIGVIGGSKEQVSVNLRGTKLYSFPGTQGLLILLGFLR